jgi:glycosyltransferase involved in cell wall biosynthesis
MISVIIPTYSRSYLLKRALDSLVMQRFPYKFEIIVVDNNSKDDTMEVVLDYIKEHPENDIKYIFEGTPGLVSSRHRGVKEAKYDILSFVDEDIEADTNWLSAIAEAFKDIKVKIVGGKVLPKYETPPPQWINWFWTINEQGSFCGWLSLTDMGEEIKEVDPTLIWGVNYSIRKTALIELNGFHPDSIADEFFCYGGDGETGLSIKARERGLKTVYKPEALIYHFVPTSRMTYEYFRKRARIQGKCDSFTQIRKLGQLPKINSGTRIIQSIYNLIKNLKRIVLFYSLSEQELLKLDFQKHYQKGYTIHQKAVKDNIDLLKWVLKEDYWDYSIPSIDKEW